MITVWCAELDAARADPLSEPAGAPSDPPGSLSEAAGPLSEAERVRAARLRDGTQRRRWIASRAALRRVLAAELDVAPESIELAVDRNGKPHLAGAHAGALEFSLSHSAALALIAISRAAPVGVDVERAEPMNDIDAVAQRYFAPEEWQALRRLAGVERVDAFYRIWTRKEAYIKATGAGMGQALDRFVVSHAGDDARVILIDGDRERAASWTLIDLRLDAPYIGAVATPVPGAHVRVERLPTDR